MTVLVGYATDHGSTRDIAERLAARLTDRQVSVKCMDVYAEPDPADFDAFVLGSAVHNGQWLPPAATFLTHHATTFGTRPVWLFSVGITPMLGGWFQRHVKEPVAITELSTVVDIRDHRFFAGAIKKEDFPRPARIAYRLGGGHYGDFRDWAAIDAWADTIAQARTGQEEKRYPGPPAPGTSQITSP